MKSVRLLPGLLLSIVTVGAWADIAVVVHPQMQTDLRREQVARIFMGQLNTFPNGQQATPLLPGEGDPLRDRFIDRILERSPNQFKAYWARQAFTGQAVPPPEIRAQEERKAFIASNPGAISVISADAVDDSVKVLFEIK